MSAVVDGTRDTADARALREMYDLYAQPLLAFAQRLAGGDRGQAEDIVQETLVRAWQQRQVLGAESGSVLPWLYTVARRIAIDTHRRRSARPAEVGGELADRRLGALPDSVDVEAGLDRIVVVDALSSLSVDHRNVLVHTYYAGRTTAEAAEVLGVPAGTVKSRTYYALKALRLALTERGVTL